jgi:hypothetical protein
MTLWCRSSGLVRLAGQGAIRQPLFRRQLFQGGLRQPPCSFFFVSELRSILHIAHGVHLSCRRNPVTPGQSSAPMTSAMAKKLML